MDNLNNISVGILILSPIIAYLVTVSDFLDLKKGTMNTLFDGCKKQLREEKLWIWQNLIIFRSETNFSRSIESPKQPDSRLCNLLEKEERRIRLHDSLHSCSKWFMLYYSLCAWAFVWGALLGASVYCFPDFFKQNLAKGLLLWLSILMAIMVIWWLPLLNSMKDKLRKDFSQIITSISF